MKNFKIYKHDVLGSVAVKDGWSWPGFFFTWIWAFVKGINNLGFTLLAIYFGLGIISAAAVSEPGLSVVITLISWGINFWIGSEGNNKYCEMLIGKGYKYEGSARESSPEMALLNYKKGAKNETGAYNQGDIYQSNGSTTAKSSSDSGYSKGNLYNKE